MDRQWGVRLIEAFRQWPEGREFLAEGGVPGCQVPPGMAVCEFGEWWLAGADPETHDPHDPRPPVEEGSYWSPEEIVDLFRNEDRAYSPDYA